MEMMIPQMTSTQPQAQVTTNGQASKSIGGAVFRKTLVQQINGDAASGTANAQVNQPVATVSKEAASEIVESAAAPTLTDLMSIIDGLLEQLAEPATEDSEAPSADEQQQLEAVLDQMNALLALLGIPVPVNPQSAKPMSAENGSMTGQQTVANIAAVKSSLQDTLLQLQAMLQQGMTKLIQQQEPALLVAQQLQALTAILKGESVDTNKPQTKSAAFSQQLFTAQTAPQAEVSTLLQRLSQQAAVHPALLSTAAQSLEQGVNSEAVTSSVETNPLVQPVASHPDSLRGFAPLVANTATAPTSFVVADEFAQSMTGLIVQKFDLTTLNGVSEAKIMLFPEHLGQVDVRITMQNGLLTAIFQTDTAMAKDMLDNQMAQLRSALQAQGLMVDKLEVSQGQSATQLSQQHHGQGSSQQQASNRQTFHGEEGSSEAQFETEMIEQAVIQGLGFGRGINVKA